jgi:thymidine kinase
MNLQYISDSKGNKTAVIIPINEWELITKIKSDLGKDSTNNEIPQWQKEVVTERIQAIKKNKNLLIDEEQFWQELENEFEN